MSDLNSNLVYLATGVEGLDNDIKKNLNKKNIVTKEIFYTDILLEDDMKAGTVIISRKLKGKVSLEDTITGLRKKGARVIYCLPSDFECFEICVSCGVYDLVEDPIKPSKIVSVYEKPMEFKDILVIKERYEAHLKATGKKVDPIKMLDKKHKEAVKVTIDKTKNEKLDITPPKIETKSILEVDVDNLFSGLDGLDPKAEEEPKENSAIGEDEDNSIQEINPEENSLPEEPNDHKDDIIEEVVPEIKKEVIKKEVSNNVMMIGTEDGEVDDSNLNNQIEPLQEDETYEISDESNLHKEKSSKVNFPFDMSNLKIPSLFSKKNESIIDEDDDHEPEGEVKNKTNEKTTEKTKKKAAEVISFKKQAKIPKTIGIIGSERSVGTTYVSTLLAFALAKKKRVLYVVIDEELYSTLDILSTSRVYPFDFLLLNNELYKLHNDYDHIIYNCGTLDDVNGHNLFYSLQKKILMTSLLPYKMKSMAAIDAASYVDLIGVLGLQKDEAYLKGIEMREDFSDSKYLDAVREKLLGGDS